MKTKEEIIRNSLSYEDVDKYIDKCTEGLNSRVQKGYDSYELVLFDGDYKSNVKLSKIISQRLNSMGFYARFGWRETTPNGNERPIVVVMLDKPPTKKSFISRLLGL